MSVRALLTNVVSEGWDGMRGVESMPSAMVIKVVLGLVILLLVMYTRDHQVAIEIWRVIWREKESLWTGP